MWFFPRYRFHDGKIMRVWREMVEEEVEGKFRLMVMHRVLYTDVDIKGTVQLVY